MCEKSVAHISMLLPLTIFFCDGDHKTASGKNDQQLLQKQRGTFPKRRNVSTAHKTEKARHIDGLFACTTTQTAEKICLSRLFMPHQRRPGRLPLSHSRTVEHFQFETLCVSNHTACRFTEKPGDGRQEESQRSPAPSILQNKRVWEGMGEFEGEGEPFG